MTVLKLNCLFFMRHLFLQFGVLKMGLGLFIFVWLSQLFHFLVKHFVMFFFETNHLLLQLKPRSQIFKVTIKLENLPVLIENYCSLFGDLVMVSLLIYCLLLRCRRWTLESVLFNRLKLRCAIGSKWNIVLFLKLIQPFLFVCFEFVQFLSQIINLTLVIMNLLW